MRCELCNIRFKSASIGYTLCPSCKDIETEQPLDDIVDLRKGNDNKPIIVDNWWNT